MWAMLWFAWWFVLVSVCHCGGLGEMLVNEIRGEEGKTIQESQICCA